MHFRLLYILLLIPFLSIGQEVKEFEPYAINLSVEDGLPSNEVYDILEDSYGRFWFCTDNGLSVFDGQQFKRVTDSSYSVIVLGGYKDKQNNIWFFTLDSEILRLKPGEHKPSLILSSEQTRKYLGDNIIAFLRMIGDDLILSTGLEMLTISNYNSSPEFEYIRGQTSKLTCICEGAECIATARIINDAATDIELIRDGDTTLIKDIPGLKKKGKYWISANISHGRLVLHSTTNILSINLSDHSYSLVKDLPRNTLSLTIEDSLIWVGSYNDGVRAFSNDDKLELKEHLFQGRSFSKLKSDQNGGLWLCSQESGIFYMPFPEITALRIAENESINISSMRSINEECFVGQYRGQVSVIRKLSGEFIHEDLTNLEGQIRKIVPDSIPGGVFVLELDKYVHYRRNGAYSEFEIKSFDQRLDFNRFRTLSQRGNKLTLRPDLYEGKAYSIEIDGPKMNRIRKSQSFGEQIFFGGFYNAYAWDTIDQELNELRFKQGPIDFRAACRVNSDTFLIGTKGDGILMTKGHEVIKQIEHEDDRLKTIRDFESLGESIWVVCPDALYEFNKKTQKLSDWTSIFLRKWVSFQGIEKIGNKLVVSSQNGYFIFDPRNITLAHQAPKIYALDIVKLDGERSSINGKITLHESEASFQLVPQSVSFVNLFRHQYRYRLSNVDTHWIVSQSDVIPFSALNPGEYQLEIEAGDGLGNWSQNTQVLKLSITPFFYKTFWFYALLVILLSSLGILFYNWRLKQVKRRNSLEIQVSTARNEALSSQLNPHFIFNSLNSINSYLAQNDNRSAMRYLGKFAKMMRNTFENSQHSYISLQEELEAVQRYAEVESLRLVNEFELKINIDPEIDTRNVLVPSLILQPIVENCIWHGIAPLKGQKGEILISVQKPEGDQMNVSISDNGVGIKTSNSKDRLDNKRKSSSAILNERFHILSRLNKVEHYIEMKANEEGQGTTVTMAFSIKRQENN